MAADWPVTTLNQQAAFEPFGFAWKAGFGAIFGLLSGKVSHDPNKTCLSN
jgi:hypothetical protein